MINLLYKKWWKYLAVLFMASCLILGLLIKVPRQPVLNETIRNLFFHVPLWMGMTFMLLLSLIFSIKYLSSKKLKHDILASELVNVSILFGVLGFLTGTLWAVNTWGSVGAWFQEEPKIIGSLLGIFLYLVYWVLRLSIQNIERRAQLTAAFNIIAFFLFVAFIYVIPRMKEFSLHPGGAGNPAFSIYDRTQIMGLVFYFSVISFILLGGWIVSLRYRMKIAEITLSFRKAKEF